MNLTTRTDALGTLVFGVDIQSGDPRGDAPTYAVVRLDGREGEGDGAAVERDVVSRRKFFRLVERDEPEVVATDNVFELAEDKPALVRLLRELPHGTRLVQVTGAERPEPLGRVASRHDVPYGKDPVEEAEAAARLAAANVGHVVSAFTDETRVKVSRGRSTGGGGWSEDRYTRKIHGAVRDQARSIESELDEQGFDYGKDVTEKYGGFANAEFVVDAPRDQVPFSNERGKDVRVEVDAVERDGLTFEPLATRRDHVAVGIDPGTTTAMAVVGLDGEIHDVASTRTADRSDVIEWIVERGRPAIVAADVAPMPTGVDKIRRSFDAAAWRPDRDLSRDRKKRLTEDHAYRCDDEHQRDALAAALAALEDHEDQFARIRRKLPRDVEEGEVIRRVLVDEDAVEAVLDELRDDGGEADEDGGEPQRERTPEERRIARLESQVERLQGHVEDLERELADRDDRIDELERDLEAERNDEMREIREAREVRRLTRENHKLRAKLEKVLGDRDDLEEKLDRLKRLWKVDHSDLADAANADEFAVVKPVEQFSSEAIERADASVGLQEGDVVLLRDATGAGRRTAERLAAIEPRLVLRRGGLSSEADEVLFEHDVPVADADMVPTRDVDELAVARGADVEDAVGDWEDRAEERRRERSEEMVDQLISEYRSERRNADS